MATKVGVDPPAFIFDPHAYINDIRAAQGRAERTGQWRLADSDNFPTHRACSQCGLRVVRGDLVLVLPTYRYSKVSTWGVDDAVIHAECLEFLMQGPLAPKQLIRNRVREIRNKYLKKT